MNNGEARSILSERLAAYRSRPYAELAARASEGVVETSEVAAPSGRATSLRWSFCGMASPMRRCVLWAR
jgi:hypothetical protein